ncbi:hypothetical protein Mmc1_2539 [Magnetococcus marinus MC-1]|uniref:Uncharacterized protein n=1 Tax=Magnetococcus marinus (strain ATCC BAA-1437 / JCM 17883 / MC-1) TaxID=156889 RepID=A0LAP6_MAGMM|nr:hypothetical protein Mmc1_2539 [Magnetococcus marinus MC-1]
MAFVSYWLKQNPYSASLGLSTVAIQGVNRKNMDRWLHHTEPLAQTALWLASLPARRKPRGLKNQLDSINAITTRSTGDQTTTDERLDKFFCHWIAPFVKQIYSYQKNIYFFCIPILKCHAHPNSTDLTGQRVLRPR